MICGRLCSADMETVDRNSGISTFFSCCTTSSFRTSFRSAFTSALLLATGTLEPPTPCHGAFSTATILGHSSVIAEAICCVLTGAAACNIAAISPLRFAAQPLKGEIELQPDTQRKEKN